ncbi:MAG: helix-turn-helix transcriptional regulator [Bacteroidales bacterium]|nr:helix-turn-helix transcriptional regulator [Bacteroidales bacterium]
MDGFSRINCSGVVFSQVDREDVRKPIHVREHTLLYVRSGRAEVVFEGLRTPLEAGDCVFLRKDYRVVVEAWAPDPDGMPFRSVALFFCRNFLMDYYRGLSRKELPQDATPVAGAVLKIPASPELESLFLSLTPYLDSAESFPQEMAWMKRREGLRCILETDRNFYASLFDFTQPWKTDLLSFMEENYLCDLSLPELARYSGRSLSAFKRDFKKVSPLTPEKWVLQRRLVEAHRLLRAGGCRVGEAMTESGFRDPAFFSRAYKKKYGYPPRETPGD